MRETDIDYENIAEETLTVIEKEHRRIITDISTDGLASSETMRSQGKPAMTSVDRETSSYTFGRTLQTSDKYPNLKIFNNAVHQALYLTSDSVMPVVAERQGETTQDTALYKGAKEERRALEERLASTALFIFEGTDEAIQTLMREEKETGPESIIAILLPNDVANHFSQKELQNLKHPVIVVKKTIKRKLYHLDELRMPDYESEIKKILLQGDNPIWIHGVRLPTQKDLDGKSTV
ncbi:hypothetical protein OAL67_01185 [bacterium]|nr:hypothetical protein [bacterium]